MVAKPESEPRRTSGVGLSVVKLLAGAAVTGAIAGVLLERTRAVPDAIGQAEAAVDRAMPSGRAPGPQRPDMTAPDPLSLRGIPPYPGASPRRLLGVKPGRGLNAISWFSTSDSLDRVLSYYEEAYAHWPVRPVTYRWGKHRGYVSWFESLGGRDGGPSDTTDGVLHMVTVSHEGSQTMVFLSATEPDKIFAGSQVLPLGVRLPAGTVPQVVDMGEFGQQRATVFASYQVGRGVLSERIAATMAESGWAIEERGEAPDGRISLVARRQGKVQIAVVEGTGERSQVLVTVEDEPTSAGRGGIQ